MLFCSKVSSTRTARQAGHRTCRITLRRSQSAPPIPQQTLLSR